MKGASIRAALAVAAAVGIFAATPASAQLQAVDIFKNTTYDQTSAAAPTTAAGYFFDVGATMTNPGDFTSASLTYPGPASPLSLGLTSPTQFGYGSPFVDQATFNASYPLGFYTVTVSNGGSNVSETMNDASDAYTVDVPALTAATFTALQGLNAGHGLTIQFNSFTPDGATTPGASAAFFSIFDSAFNTVFTSGGLDPSTTSIYLPAGTLKADTTYSWELDFSDRIVGADPNGLPIFTTQGFDMRTDGSFSTAVPEPATWAMLMLGLFGSGAALRRRRVALATAT